MSQKLKSRDVSGQVADERVGELAGERGAVAVVVAIMIGVLLAFVALAVDIGYVCVTKNQLQDTADASALAAARQLGSLYQGMSYDVQQNYTADADRDDIVDVAQDVAGKNTAAGKDVELLDAEVVLGQWSAKTFTPTNTQPDAVRVIARRDTTVNGPVNTFFAQVMGIDSFTSGADAVAALTGQSTATPGELELPIGISRWFFERPSEEGFCDQDIKFYPTNDEDSCAGWTSFDIKPASDNTLGKILSETPGYENPETNAGETFYEFTGGTLSTPTFDQLLLLFQRKGYDVHDDWSYILDAEGNPVHQATDAQGAVPLFDDNGVRLEYPDGTRTTPPTPRNKHKWETSVVIYDYVRQECDNPNQDRKIVGFAQVEMRDVLNAPDKLVKGIVKCNYVGPENNRGGGGDYGLKGSIPGLVE